MDITERSSSRNSKFPKCLYRSLSNERRCCLWLEKAVSTWGLLYGWPDICTLGFLILPTRFLGCVRSLCKFCWKESECITDHIVLAKEAFDNGLLFTSKQKSIYASWVILGLKLSSVTLHRICPLFIIILAASLIVVLLVFSVSLNKLFRFVFHKKKNFTNLETFLKHSWPWILVQINHNNF